MLFKWKISFFKKCIFGIFFSSYKLYILSYDGCLVLKNFRSSSIGLRYKPSNDVDGYAIAIIFVVIYVKSKSHPS